MLMSKSVNEVVFPDVKSAWSSYEFRHLNGELVDCELEIVCYEIGRGYLTHNGKPVFLHRVGNPAPCFLFLERQHPEELDYWKEKS